MPENLKWRDPAVGQVHVVEQDRRTRCRSWQLVGKLVYEPASTPVTCTGGCATEAEAAVAVAEGIVAGEAAGEARP